MSALFLTLVEYHSYSLLSRPRQAEDATRQVLRDLTVEEKRSLVAVVDPPRAGLHNDVVKALRACLPLRYQS